MIFMLKRKQSSLKGLAEVFALIGAVFLMLSSVISLIGISLVLPWILHGKTVIFSLSKIVNNMILILIGLIILAGYDVIKISLKIKMEWSILLVFGIVALILGRGWERF